MTFRQQIQKEFNALYSIYDLFIFRRIKSFWAVIKISFFTPVYETTVGFLISVSEILCPQKRYIQRFKPL